MEKKKDQIIVQLTPRTAAGQLLPPRRRVGSLDWVRSYNAKRVISDRDDQPNVILSGID